MDAVWPIISNREAIAVNQAWAGHSGSAFYRSASTVTLGEVNYAAVQKGMGVAEVAALVRVSFEGWLGFLRVRVRVRVS